MASTCLFDNAIFDPAIFDVCETADTHDGLPKKFYLPIYERTKKPKYKNVQEILPNTVIDELQKVAIAQIPVDSSLRSASKIEPIRWNNAAIEAYADKANLTLMEAQRRLDALWRAKEAEEEEMELMQLMAIAALH
ncbi:MAG: hypothetical protein ACH344_08700 [Yersinia sp. (in: enterobacteria)]